MDSGMFLKSCTAPGESARDNLLINWDYFIARNINFNSRG